MVISDEILKKILVFVGVIVGHITPSIKICAITTVSFCYASLIYFIAASLRLVLDTYNKLGISQILLALNASLIWLTCFLRRKNFSVLIQKLYSIRNCYDIQNDSSPVIKFFTGILIILLFLVSQGKYFFASSQSTFTFWTLKSKIPEGFFKLCIIIVINLISFATNLFPVFVTFILSIILYKTAEFFHFYNISLKSQLHTVKINQQMEFLEDFSIMLKLLRRMNKVMNYPLFFSVVHSLYEIFMALHFLILSKNKLNYAYIANVFLAFTYSMAMLLMYSVCSSMVTENMTKVTVTAREILNNYIFGSINSIPQNVLLCLRRIETEKIVYISVCDVFILSKSFILSAIGVALTYDLLIINAFTNEWK